MSSSRDQISLIGVPGICFGDHHGLAHVVAQAAPAEAAAQVVLVDIAFGDRQAGRLGADRQRGFAILRRTPDLAACPAYRAPSRSSAPWWRGPGTDSCRPPRPAWPRCASAALASPALLPTKACSASSPSLSMAAIGVAGDFDVVAAVPFDRQRGDRGLGLPEGVGRPPRRRVADLHDLLHARLAFAPCSASKLFTLPLSTGLSLIDAHQHARQLDVEAVDLRSRWSCGAVSSRLSGLPAMVQSLASLSGTSFGASSLLAASATLP